MDQDEKSYDNSLNNLVIFPDQSPVNIYNSLTEESLRIYIDGMLSLVRIMKKLWLLNF